MNRGTAIVGISILMALLVVASANSCSFGEYASPNGRINLTVQVNHTEDAQWVLCNGYNYSLGFYVIPPSFNGIPNDPIVTFSTMNGIIKGNSTFVINITASVPYGTSINKTWTGYAQAVSFVPNASQNGGGASINIATDKLLEVNSESSSTSTTSTTTSSSTTTIATTSIESSGGSGIHPGVYTSTSTTSTTTSTMCFLFCLTSSTSTTSSLQNTATISKVINNTTSLRTSSTPTTTINDTATISGQNTGIPWNFILEASIAGIIVIIIAFLYFRENSGGVTET